MNNNKLDEAALLAGCRGVFSKASYITMGSKEKPEEYIKKIPPRSVYTGKHFATIPGKDGFTNEVYFEKKHNWISDGDKYIDKLRYKDSGQEKKKGFLTSDFSKRDEFSNVIRTEQWREQLSQESNFASKALESFASNAGLDTFQQATKKEEPELLLYDLVFEKEDPNFTGASKTHRDTKNRTQLTKDRNLGSMSTTTALTYTAPTEHTKPDYARKPIVRDTFFRRENVLFPGGCAADPGL
uniref:Flagellar associated protein n=1 Tax=Polytomella parva TaxID=51329 RepID=A0A7S0YM86_9CHLO|mmetsp:Transcript_28250/g.52050  ORF Transcript_28250/g.52050 Transcript_28250/m.52050 type:complete len:241 (+) Transcript_28250:99-821(+)|eukprot:CAMPEP_0175087168 /NCGR_PEP_ID=MMETSP0052_2-20121109/29678_1 /TAXON_ID=51329 ORGANISM="Polytomella parva, Strain SAG 63-3" /NCGR_SAMPLE_ID=MMETSP0052_2 /ASSEMBLY_ACC=CAM_ASM_000194 /LENGTH=240 /DNA_ID=CAMNT_0016359479 /DNA_START=64 /DNA_END=786 /DNA_ORIENTATION=-